MPAALPKQRDLQRVAEGLMRISPLEAELVQLFVRLAHVIGLPRSTAEVYAIFFAATEPLSMDDIIGRIGLSQGAVSQGIKQLRGFGAIKPVYVPGDRRTYYEVEDNLRKVAAGFLKEQILPQLEDWPQRLAHIEALFREAPNDHRHLAAMRAEKLSRWHKRSQETIPVVLDLIGKWE